MTQQPNGNNLEVLRIVRMLEKTVEMAQDAELTGSLGDRSAAAVRSFNTTVRHLVDTGQVPAALFAALPDDANLTDVAMSSAQLAEYLRAGLPEQEQEQGQKKISRDLVIGNLNIGAGGDKDEISQMIREHLAEWLRENRPEAGKNAPEPSEASAAPAETATPAGGEASPAARRALPSQQARVEELRSEPQRAETRR